MAAPVTAIPQPSLGVTTKTGLGYTAPIEGLPDDVKAALLHKVRGIGIDFADPRMQAFQAAPSGRCEDLGGVSVMKDRWVRSLTEETFLRTRLTKDALRMVTTAPPGALSTELGVSLAGKNESTWCIEHSKYIATKQFQVVRLDVVGEGIKLVDDLERSFLRLVPAATSFQPGNTAHRQQAYQDIARIAAQYGVFIPISVIFGGELIATLSGRVGGIGDIDFTEASVMQMLDAKTSAVPILPSAPQQPPMSEKEASRAQQNPAQPQPELLTFNVRGGDTSTRVTEVPVQGVAQNQYAEFQKWRTVLNPNRPDMLEPISIMQAVRLSELVQYIQNIDQDAKIALTAYANAGMMGILTTALEAANRRCQDNLRTILLGGELFSRVSSGGSEHPASLRVRSKTIPPAAKGQEPTVADELELTVPRLSMHGHKGALADKIAGVARTCAADNFTRYRKDTHVHDRCLSIFFKDNTSWALLGHNPETAELWYVALNWWLTGKRPV